MTRKPEAVSLTNGSKYIITSLGNKDSAIVTRGTFRGYTVIGNVDGVCIELDGSHKGLRGKVRVIPSHMILAIDIIDAARPTPQVTEESIERYYR
ncbi:MAG: hypothetical protein FJ149_05605 [Euryarchaeota archaeon]|nr:hypothetical protein [Euryarchaeota archaeon]